MQPPQLLAGLLDVVVLPDQLDVVLSHHLQLLLQLCVLPHQTAMQRTEEIPHKSAPTKRVNRVTVPKNKDDYFFRVTCMHTYRYTACMNIYAILSMSNIACHSHNYHKWPVEYKNGWKFLGNILTRVEDQSNPQ